VCSQGRVSGFLVPNDKLRVSILVTACLLGAETRPRSQMNATVTRRSADHGPGFRKYQLSEFDASGPRFAVRHASVFYFASVPTDSDFGTGVRNTGLVPVSELIHNRRSCCHQLVLVIPSGLLDALKGSECVLAATANSDWQF
jgi:hypothetical protein